MAELLPPERNSVLDSKTQPFCTRSSPGIVTRPSPLIVGTFWVGYLMFV